MKELYERSSELFADASYESELARAVWDVVSEDAHLYSTIVAATSEHTIAQWCGLLATTIPLKQSKHYTAVAIDGSQIYPDRHQGTSCFLINMGTASLGYDQTNTAATFCSEPTVFLGNEYEDYQMHISPDVVNLIREEMELKTAVSFVQEKSCSVIFFDGPLTFWFLDNKEQEVKNYFFSSYIASLWQLYDKRIPSIGYISMPRSKDIASILRTSISLLEHYQSSTEVKYDIMRAIGSATDEYKEKITKRLLDTTICRWFLKPYERTTLFCSNSSICEQYPKEIKPYFFYMHVGSEIVRIEISAWLAHDADLLHFVCGVIIDQSAKGLGYPVCLAEAHEQAVIKGPDRDFFYHMLAKIGIAHKKRFAASYKSMKKRAISI